MKVQTEWAGGLRHWRVQAHPAALEAGRCLVQAGIGFVLAGAGLAGSILPLAAAWVAAGQSVIHSALALVGAAFGAVILWDMMGALELVAICLLAFAARCIFAGVARAERMIPAVCGTAVAAVGLVFLVDAGWTVFTISQYLGKILLTVVAAIGFRWERSESDSRAQLLCAACFIIGLGAFSMPAGIQPAAAVAAFFAASAERGPRGIAAAAILGLACELSAPGCGVVAALTLAAVLCAVEASFPQGAQRGIFASVSALGMLLCGATPLEAASAFSGGVAAIAMPRQLFVQKVVSRRNAQLDDAAASMETLHGLLVRETARPAGPPEAAVVFDKAAAQVCRCCVRYQICWERAAADTYRELCQMAKSMLERGIVVREDFPDGFASRCRHLEGFAKAINQELDSLAYRRQTLARVQETRAIAADQYRFLSQILEEAAQPAQPPAELRFRYEVGIRSRSRGAVSGDRGISLRGPGDTLYLLLCDGMGTGAGAAEESATAIRILTGLLRAGASPESALQLLNGAYTLRSDGAFSTVDLLQVSLATGESTLYKWGAAASYLRQEGRVKKIGTATIPPGFGVGGNHAAGQTKLSLRGEELVVLLSDGAQSKQTEQCIASYGGTSPEELAEWIVRQQPAEDDVTAVVLRLRSAV